MNLFMQTFLRPVALWYYLNYVFSIPLVHLFLPLAHILTNIHSTKQLGYEPIFTKTYYPWLIIFNGT